MHGCIVTFLYSYIVVKCCILKDQMFKLIIMSSYSTYNLCMVLWSSDACFIKVIVFGGVLHSYYTELRTKAYII